LPRSGQGLCGIGKFVAIGDTRRALAEDDRRSPGHTVGADFAAQVPHSLLRLIPNAGHVCNAEQPEVVNVADRESATNR